MRIIHLMKDYKPTISGAAVRNSSMLENYKEVSPKDEVYIVDLDGNSCASKSVENNIVVYRKQSLHDLIKCTVMLLRKHKIDVIHAHNFRFIYAAFVAKKIAKQNFKIVAEIHALYHMKWYKEVLAYYLLRKTDKVVVLANCAKDYLIKQCEIESEKICVIRNGIENGKKDDEFDSLLVEQVKKLKREYRILIYTGSFYDWQGVIFLAQNFDEILEKHPTLAIVMVGDGPEYEKVTSYWKQAENQNRIIIHGGVSKTEISKLLDLIDIVCIPRIKNLSTDTAIPLKVVEAMMHKKIIISSNDDGLTEILNSENAVLFDSQKINQLNKGLNAILANKEYSETLAEQAQKDVYRNFTSWEENAHKLVQLYKEICCDK